MCLLFKIFILKINYFTNVIPYLIELIICIKYINSISNLIR